MKFKLSRVAGITGAMLSACCAPQKVQPRTSQDHATAASKAEDNEQSSDDPWASSTETALKRRAAASGIRVREVNCTPLVCKLRLVVGPTDDEQRRVDTWIKANWTFRWTEDAELAAASEAQLIDVTLYRHPADEMRTTPEGFSSLGGTVGDACTQGADCRHPNWDQPRLCERNATGCPTIEWNGALWCFENLTLACDCAKLQGPSVARQLSGCENDGYPY